MTDDMRFRPVEMLNWQNNRSERSHQVKWLAPLLEQPDGRSWLLAQLGWPLSKDEAESVEVFHLCFPLRDIFTADFRHVRNRPALELQFISFYNYLFGLPEDFGIHEVWKTAPGVEIRHPAAGGRSGWYEAFLQERIPNQEHYKLARDMRRMLGTEADLLLITGNFVILVGLKYKSNLRTEQYERHLMMGGTLARRLNKAFHFGMVVEDERDPRFVQLDVPYVTWSTIEKKLKEK